MNVFGFEEQEGMGQLYLIIAVNKTPTKGLYRIQNF